MGFRFSPEKLRRHLGPNYLCHCPDTRIERLIRWTIEEADQQGLPAILVFTPSRTPSRISWTPSVLFRSSKRTLVDEPGEGTWRGERRTPIQSVL